MNIHRFIIGIEIFLIIMLSYAVCAQEKAKEYKLTEVQQLRLSNTQKDAIILKAQLQDIQRQFQDKVSQLMQEAQKVKLENGWPPDTSFNPDNLQFSAPAKEGDKK